MHAVPYCNRIFGLALGSIALALSLLPLVGGILSMGVDIVGYVWDVYATAGIVFAILKFVKVFK